VICMKDKGKKAGMTLVIAVGPKMPKKPTETSKPDKMKKYGGAMSSPDPMKKAWDFLKFEPGDPLIDAMGRSMATPSRNFDEYGLPYSEPIEDEYDEMAAAYGERDGPEREELEDQLDSGLHIDQEHLKRIRPDLFDMPNPMDRKPDKGRENLPQIPPEATDYYRNAINEILSQVNRENSPIERRSPPKRL